MEPQLRDRTCTETDVVRTSIGYPLRWTRLAGLLKPIVNGAGTGPVFRAETLPDVGTQVTEVKRSDASTPLPAVRPVTLSSDVAEGQPA